MGDTLVAEGGRETTHEVIASIVAIRHDPCGPCSVRGLSWILRERSRNDAGLIGTSLVSQDGRTEHYRAGRSEIETA